MLIKILEPNFQFVDERGKLIQLVREGYKQFNIIESHANVLRGGHFHLKNEEAFFILEGSLNLDAWKDGESRVERYIFNKGDMFEIPRGVAHSFEFVQDSLLVSMYSLGVEEADGGKDIVTAEIPDEERTIINF